VVKIQVEVFWVVTSRRVVTLYDISVLEDGILWRHHTPWRHNPEDSDMKFPFIEIKYIQIRLLAGEEVIGWSESLFYNDSKWKI